jgi:hypothetical protein
MRTGGWDFGALILACVSAYGQQAIINMPSADITPGGKNFLMHESQWRQWNPGRYWLATSFYCRGIGHATELALTNWNAGTPAAQNLVTGIGFKSAPQFWKEKHPHREVKLTVGQMTTFSHRGQGAGAFGYAHLSMRLPRWNSRVTGGGWFGTKNLFKRNTGDILLGFEHPLDAKGRYIWVNEWFRGRHDFGFYITGLLFHPTKSQIVVAAYKFANMAANGKNGVVLEYGLTF